MTYKTESTDANVSYADISVMCMLKQMYRLRKHPKQTQQGYDFFMNLDIY